MNKEQLQAKYQAIMQAKLANVKHLKEIEARDSNVKNIMDHARVFYRSNLDTMSEDELLRVGGLLLGSYASVGVMAGIKRAERDAAEQTYDELLSSMTIFNKDDATGITEARAKAKEQLTDIGSELVWREQHYRSYDAIVEATKATISFIQSAVKVKLGERMATARFGDEHV